MLNQGQILERKYEVIKVLGHGGMGTVYLCRNKRLGNLWAVKEVNSELKNKVDFLTEPNMLKKLNHTGIVRIVDIFYEDDNLYIVEDYIEGKNLKEYVDANGALSSELVVNISLQLCSILDYLHSFKPPIVYRDLKPSNIMITPENKVVLIDFGIARIYKENQEGDTVILGSRGYMAPEQFMNNQSNIKTDIYSLGATMFFMVTGKSISLLINPMSEKNYPTHTARQLVEIIQKALAEKPENRYSNVKIMISEFKSITDDKECIKTIVMNSNRCRHTKNVKTIVARNKKTNNRVKLIMIAIFSCIIILSAFLAALMNNKQSNEKGVDVPIIPKTSVKTEPKQELNKIEPKLEEGQKKQEQNPNDQLKNQVGKNIEKLKKTEEKQNKKQEKEKKKQKVKHNYDIDKD